MQRHQLNGIFVLFSLTFTGFQRCTVEELCQHRSVFLFGFKTTSSVDQLIEVVQTGLTFFSLFFFVMFDQATVMDDVIYQLVQFNGIHSDGHLINQCLKAGNRVAGTLG